MVDWSREELAATAKVGTRTIIDFERNARAPRQNTLTAIRSTLEAVGIELLDGDEPGVKVRRKPRRPE